jgi:hypothetical protein
LTYRDLWSWGDPAEGILNLSKKAGLCTRYWIWVVRRQVIAQGVSSSTERSFWRVDLFESQRAEHSRKVRGGTGFIMGGVGF